MSAGQFRSAVWDPVLIIAQIVTMQSVYYVCLGLWMCVMCFIINSHRSLDQFFSYQAMICVQVLQFKEFQGKFVMFAYFLNALTGALGLWYIVKRTKQCWDFAATVHLFHLLVCWGYNQAFPCTLSWWLVTLISVIIMTVLGEFLCMRTELQAIPLSVGAKVDL